MSTIKEIYDRLALSKASMQELHGYVVDANAPGSILDNSETLVIDAKSGSKVASWRLWLWIMAVESWIVENLFINHKKEITDIIDSRRPHTLRWYALECKKYQHGHPLSWNGAQFVYARDDEQAKIVKYASVSERYGNIVLKVAKETDGSKAPLTTVEKNAFAQFWEQWKDAGSIIEVVSQGADLLKIDISIVRDRMVLNDDNTLIRDSSVRPIDQALSAFLGGLEFDAILRLSKLTDAVQAAEGVVDVKVNQAWHKSATGTYQEIDLFATAASGYFTLDTDSIVTYIDNVGIITV